MYEIFDQPPAWQGASVETSGEDDVFKPPEEAPDSDEPAEQDYPYMEVTYVMSGFEKEPGFDGVYEQAADWLEMPGGMLETFKLFPVNIS